MMKNSKKGRYIKNIIIGIALIGIVSSFIFLKKRKVSGDSYTVGYGDILDEIRLAGVVDDKHRVDLGFARGGRVAKVYVEEGQRVKKGELLATLDLSREYAQVKSAKMDYLLTKINTEISAKDADIDYEKLLSEQKARVEALRKEFLSSNLQAKLVGENNVTRTLPVPAPTISGTYKGDDEGSYFIHIYRSHAPSGYSFDLTGIEGEKHYSVETYQPGKLGEQGLYIQFPSKNLYRYNNTDWEVRIPNEDSPQYFERKHAYENALKKYDELKEKLSLSKRKFHDESISGIPYTQAIVERSRSQLGTHLSALEEGRIRAPFDGIIVQNDLEPGKIVSGFTPVMRIVSGKKKVSLDVPEVYVNRIQVGEKADINLDAYPEIHYEGVLEYIDEIEKGGDGSSLYGADVAFVEQDSNARIGMSATVTFSKLMREHVLTIPSHFVFYKKEKPFVLLKKDNKSVEERQVQLGFKGNGGLVEIISGLSEGDEILFSKREV